MRVEDVTDWPATLRDLLEQPGRLRAHVQPIVDLQRAQVCGYEALARFTGLEGSPAGVFAAAAEHGYAIALEARMVRTVLDARAFVGPNRFLTVNVSPAVLVDPLVQRAFADAGSLGGVVVEVTEQTDGDPEAMTAALAGLRERGALIAVDDAGAGYGSLERIALLRPDFVKVDRALVSGIDADPAKAAVVETLGDLAGRIDAWIIAEGVERTAELDALLRLRVPLGQGYAFGRPAPAPAELGAELTAHVLRHRALEQDASTVGPLAESALPVREPVDDAGLTAALDADLAPEALALVDDRDRPTGLVLRRPYLRGEGVVRELLCVTPDMPLTDVGRRAMTRPAERRFDPLVLWDETGRYTGLVRLERVVDALAA